MESQAYFIEKWMSEFLEIPYIPFQLNSGKSCALITDVNFTLIYQTLDGICQNETKSNEKLRPIIVPSDILGAKVILHKWYVDDDVLDGLTGSLVKNMSSYNEIKMLGPSSTRFSVDEFKVVLKNTFNKIINPEAPINLEEPKVIFDDTAVPQEKNIDKIQEMINLFFENSSPFVSQEFENYKSNFGFNPEDEIIDYCFNFMKTIKKNIIIIEKSTTSYFLNKLKDLISGIKNENKNPENYLLIIHFDVKNYSDFYCSASDSIKPSMCLGHNTSAVYSPISDNTNFEIEKAKQEKKFDIVNDLIQKRKNSPYSKYDGIYKDTVTNVVFGLKSKENIYLLVKYAHSQCYSVIFDELARRLNNKIPYSSLKEIDLNYYKERKEKDIEDYIEFAVTSSKEFMSEIRKKFENVQIDYQESFNKTMELGKIMQRLKEQISNFSQRE